MKSAYKAAGLILFTFQSGSILIRHKGAHDEDAAQFTFQSGSILIAFAATAAFKDSTFTFQSGSILITVAVDRRIKSKGDLHSNLVLF